MNKNIVIVGGSSYIGKYLIKNFSKTKGFTIYSSFFHNPTKNNNIKEFFLDIYNFKKDNLNIIPKKIYCLLVLSWPDLHSYQSIEHKKFSRYISKFVKFFLEKHFVESINVLGSCLEYGVVNGKINENHPCHPSTRYGKSKILFLNNLLNLKNKYHFKLNWMRVFYLYGDTRNRGIWSQFIKAKDAKTTFKMSGGEQLFDFIHIKTLIRYIQMIIILNKDNKIINLCSGKPKRLLHMVSQWSEKFQVKLNIGYYPYTSYEGMRYWGDNKKISKVKYYYKKKFEI